MLNQPNAPNDAFSPWQDRWTPHVRYALMAPILLLILASCAHVNRRHLIDPAPLLAADTSSVEHLALVQLLQDSETSPFLKAHMLNGHVYVLSDRVINSGAQSLEGFGVLLDLSRDTLAAGPLTVPLDSVVLFETNQIRLSGSSTALTVITGASLALTVYCLTNTKACFGSCPTFYVSDGDSLMLQAEGFSSSIAPSLEARDVDALYRARPDSATVRVTMKNEALETHVVRHVDLLLVPKAAHERVLRDVHGTFWRVPTLSPPSSCSAPEGDCRHAVQAFDGDERYSLADSTNLATKEFIDLTFDVPASRPDSIAWGLAIGARQTLLTTYLLYQTLAYMGHEAGAWLAWLERNADDLRDLKPTAILSGIEVLVQDSTGAWTSAGQVNEHGPLATDVHMIPLPPLPPGTVNVRLRLTKGNWRLDYLALAELGARANPVRLPPNAVHREGILDEQALARLHDAEATLTTLPGDSYTLTYAIPEGYASYELFLESKGYYLEWIRKEWLKEQDPQRAAQMLFAPQQALQELAPAYKKVEADMEEVFWRSRYAR